MPKPKKGGRGGPREGAGKKTDGPQSKSSSKVDRNIYDRERRAKERGQLKKPEQREESSR